MICRALGEDAVFHSTCRNFRDFGIEILISRMMNGQSKKFKDDDLSSWPKICAKHNQNLLQH